MHDCGLYSIEDMRPINELRMRARWKLGGALKATERMPEGRPPKNTVQAVNSFWKWVKEQLALERATVVDAQRIGTMPDDELTKAYNEAREAGRLLHYNELVIRARPWWYKENRKAKARMDRRQTDPQTMREATMIERALVLGQEQRPVTGLTRSVLYATRGDGGGIGDHVQASPARLRWPSLRRRRIPVPNAR
jgi:hypothetical protein